MKLTFEHVPPKSSFNEGRQEVFGLMDFLNRPPSGKMTGGRIEQRGAGEWSLCENCNNKTGSWYVPELGRATAAGVTILRQLPLKEIDANPDAEVVRVGFSGVERKPRPLLLIKQIITMLLAISQTELSLKNPELGDFVSTASERDWRTGTRFTLRCSQDRWPGRLAERRVSIWKPTV
jgi:hypothetical protein